MRIYLLEKREPFLEIFQQTMSDYWSHIAKEKITVENIEGNATGEVLYGHRFFNFFVGANANSNVFEPLKKEYSQSTSLLKTAGLKSYFNLSTNRFTMRPFAHFKMKVTPFIPEQEPYIVFGGNTRLRLMHPDKKESVVILKKGFNPNFIRREIKFKSLAQLTCAPKMLSFNEEVGILTEEYTPGFPINRLSENERNQLSKEAWQLLNKEVIAPFIKKPTSEKVAELNFKRVENFVDRRNTPAVINILLKDIIKLFKASQPPSIRVKLSWAHGDFQDANILKTADGIKIIDWETVAKRTVFYDLFTLLFGARLGDFNQDNIENILKTKSAAFEAHANDLEVNWEQERSTYLYLYLLEELLYRLQSKFSKAYYKNGDGISPFLSTMKLILKKNFAQKTVAKSE